MPALVALNQEIAQRVLSHLLGRIQSTLALDEPFSHIYLEDAFPPDIYRELLAHLPDPKLYLTAAGRHYGQGDGQFTRSMFHLSRAQLAVLSDGQREVLGGIAAALTAPAVKQAMYAKLAKDLAFRYGVAMDQVPQLAGYSRPTLYRETDGFEIAPHPDTRKKVVTMQFYLPADQSQLDLGTALYQRRLLAWPFGGWQHKFVKVKQFLFQPNSAYAFVVNNSLTRKSWHGREKLPTGAGIRNTLLNTFYGEKKE